MAIGLQINNLIKFILGAILVVVIVGGVYLFFKDYIIDFAKNLIGGGEAQALFLSLI